MAVLFCVLSAVAAEARAGVVGGEGRRHPHAQLEEGVGRAGRAHDPRADEPDPRRKPQEREAVRAGAGRVEAREWLVEGLNFTDFLALETENPIL